MYPGKAYKNLDLLPGDKFTTSAGSLPKTVVEPPSNASLSAADEYIFYTEENNPIIYALSNAYLNVDLYAVKRNRRGNQAILEDEIICPKCGSAGEWVNFAFKCTNHACWNVW